MTVNLFLILIMALAIINSLITEAIKKVYEIKKPTLLVAILSAGTGWLGGITAYILLGIAVTPASVVALILLAPAIWLVATLGYDKVKEIILQVTGLF